MIRLPICFLALSFLSLFGAEVKPPTESAAANAHNRIAMTTRDGHSPTEEANEQVCRFFEWALAAAAAAKLRRSSLSGGSVKTRGTLLSVMPELRARIFFGIAERFGSVSA